MVRKWSARVWSVLIGVALLLIGVVLGTVYLRDRYFFNPLTFGNNDVLYLPWKWYTNPLNMQVLQLTSPPTKVVEITVPSQIRYVITELEKGSTIKAIPINESNRPTTIQTYTILIRTKGTLVLQLAYLFPKEKLAEIWTQHGNLAENEFISLTPGLLEYVKKQLGQ
jgi:hypothetical protein